VKVIESGAPEGGSGTVTTLAPPAPDNVPAEVRQQLALELIEQRGFVRVTELSSRFGVSTVTARSDLHALEVRGLAQRVHGGAMPKRRSTIERSFEEVAGDLAAEKRRIGLGAAQLVTTGESIVIDVGTTAAAFSQALTQRYDLTDVTVFTNGIKIALELESAHPRLTVIVTGGTLRPKQHSLVNPLASSMLRDLQASTVFLGCNGIDLDAGITNINLPEAEVKRAMIAAARRVVVLADATKLGVRTLAPVCRIDEIDVLVTDTSADPHHVDALRERGVDVITC